MTLHPQAVTKQVMTNSLAPAAAAVVRTVSSEATKLNGEVVEVAQMVPPVASKNEA